jgi:hypothetical protein
MKDIMSIEQEIKGQFSKVFTKTDWAPFKKMADYYFQLASKLKNEDIEIEKKNKLWIRNVRKRLYLGIATELLIKAVYLRKGYNINKPKRGKEINFPELITHLNATDLDETKTYMLDDVIAHFHEIEPSINTKIKRGLIICKVFRNKEGHISVFWQNFDPQNYTDIEYSIIEIYKICFGQKLTFRISMEPNEKAVFKIDECVAQ